VNTDPRRIASVAQLRDMTGIAHLLRHWQISGDADAARSLRQYILDWTSTYRITGNDVNENKFYPMLVAYLALREAFDPADRQQVDRFVEQLGASHHRAVQNADRFTNRYGKHVRLLAISGLILDRPAWIAAARDGIRRFVTQSLYADGTSEDLKRRDTLTYHGSSLKPLLELAIVLGARELYTWESAEGGSLKKSVDYVVPYAMGQKTREEWTNSEVDLDRRRAEAGLEKYRPGRLFDPADALELMELASYFDADLVAVVRHLSGADEQRFPTWRMLMNHVARETP
jgi:hypothetical protein